MADILVVDDDQSVASAFESFLRFEHHVSRVASNGTDALSLIADRQPDVVIMDVRMPGIDGLQTLQTMRERYPDVDVVMMTGYSSSQTSIEAIRYGAFDYLTKPLDLDQLRAVIGKVLVAREARKRAGLAEAGPPTEPPVTLVGQAPAMLDIYKTIGRLATNDVPVLVIGEPGTGRHLLISTIHQHSVRRDRPLVWIDCATLPEAILEAELFGGHQGTLHLSAIDGMPLTLQARLVRALEGHRARQSAPALHARVLASSEQNLPDLVRSGRFSRELYEAVSVITLKLPPLRERREDIPLLARHFVQRFNEELSRAIKGIDDRAMRLLEAHHWPGNVAELERVIKRASIEARSDVITVDDVGDRLQDSRFSALKDAELEVSRSVRAALRERLVLAKTPSPSPYHAVLDLVETALVDEALAITNGNQVKASEILGVNRATLRKKMPADE